MVKRKMNPESVGLPHRKFLFTLDQIATVIEMNEQTLKQEYVFFFGRTPGDRPLDMLMARNISNNPQRPEWRVAEQELIRWMRRKGFRVYDTSWAIK